MHRVQSVRTKGSDSHIPYIQRTLYTLNLKANSRLNPQSSSLIWILSLLFKEKANLWVTLQIRRSQVPDFSNPKEVSRNFKTLTDMSCGERWKTRLWAVVLEGCYKVKIDLDCMVVWLVMRAEIYQVDRRGKKTRLTFKASKQTLRDGVNKEVYNKHAMFTLLLTLKGGW